MADDDARNNNNQRVTNALLQKDIEQISKKLDLLPEMQKQLSDIETTMAVTNAKCNQNKEDINDLQRKSNINDTIIAVGAVVAGIVGSLFGGNR